MKKILQITVVLVFCSVVGLLQAQNSSFISTEGINLNSIYDNDYRSGIILKGGLNLNTMVYGTDSNIKSKIGFHFGASYEREISNSLFLDAGLLLDTRGYRYDNYDNYEFSRNYLTLMVPIKAKAKFELIQDVNLFAEMGPYMNFLLIGYYSTKEKKGRRVVEHNDTIDIQGFEDRFQYGITFGTGVEFQSFVVGIGYDIELNRALITNLKTSGYGRLNSLKLSVGYRF